MLTITISLAQDIISRADLDKFQEDLNSILVASGVGSCGSGQIISTGYYEIQVYLTHLHTGFNILKTECQNMTPQPKVTVYIIGKDNEPIQIFPENSLASYLEGLEKGDRFRSPHEKQLGL